jgi:hypothetical protein
LFGHVGDVDADEILKTRLSFVKKVTLFSSLFHMAISPKCDESPVFVVI